MPPDADDVRRDAPAGARGEVFARFAELLFAHMAPADLAERTQEALMDATQSLWDLAANRVPRQINLRVREASPPARTIVEIVNDDMPFLLELGDDGNDRRGLDAASRYSSHPYGAARRGWYIG